MTHHTTDKEGAALTKKMILKARNADLAYALIFIIPAVLIVLHLSGFKMGVFIFFAGVSVVLNGMKKTFYKIVLEENTLTVKWCYFLIRRTNTYKSDNLFLEIIYSGSTGKPADAMLNVFEGTKCMHQVHVKDGFSEEQFRELIAVFEAAK